MILDRKEKQNFDIKDYPIGYAEWLSEVSDTIQNVEAFVTCLTDPLDENLFVQQLLFSPTDVSVWLAAGTPTAEYKVTVQVTTAAGRQDEVEFIMRIKDY